MLQHTLFNIVLTELGFAYSEVSDNHNSGFLVDKLGHIDLASSLVQ